ncbi:MAG TPA: family 10 glycosylhydrolase, partial [Prolixibacteraceae bacterium]|nr:family 10 glycosylhydrolase [Prolixibacteraceae bacterium]
MKKIVLIGLLLGFAARGFGQAAPKREMRAVWIATVENIDWPSVTGLTTEQQKREMVEILDQVKAFNMNTVVFQIRPDADALYASPLEPWSEWLSGRQGAAPDPWYDPLEFAISECRKRGLDIHVWFNPY